MTKYWCLVILIQFIFSCYIANGDFPFNDQITVPMSYDNLSKSNKTTRNAIVMLIHKFDVDRISSSISMLDNFCQDGKGSDIIIFHHDYPFKEDMEGIRSKTSRFVDFVNVDICLSRAPNIKNFDLFNNNPSWYKRGKWSYHTMIRFWFHDIFHLQVMKNVQYYMRIDDDSKFRARFQNVFDTVKGKNAVYMANGQYKEACKEDLPGIELLEVSAKRYVKENHIKPKNPGKWDNAFPDSTVFTYSTNFEVAKTEFFHRPEVRNWTDYILGEGGIYKYRWGDAPLRFLTLALFAEDREVLHRQHHGIHYCHPC